MKTFNILSSLSLLFISFAAHIDATSTAASSATWLRLHNELKSSSSQSLTSSSSPSTRGVGWFGKAQPTFLQRQEEPYPIASLMSSANNSVAEEKDDDEFTSDDALAFTWIGFALAFMLKNF